MLQHRQTLAKIILEEDDLSDIDDQSDESTSSTPVGSPAHVSSCYTNGSSWLDCDYSDQDNRSWSSPSPTWSSATTTSSQSTCISQSSVPSFFLEEPSSSGSQRFGSRGRKNTDGESKQSRRQQSYKHNKVGQLSPSARNHCDQAKVNAELIAFKDTLSRCGGSSDSISRVLVGNWQVLLNALKSHDTSIGKESLEILTTLAAQNLIQPHTVLHMLQHGLIINLYASLCRIDNGTRHVVALLLNIARSTPAAIPYMIELMSNSDFFHEFDQTVLFGSDDNIRVVTEFYHQISETMMAQLYPENQQSRIQPLMPEILLHTGVSKQTMDLYSPSSTIAKCLRPSLLHNLVKRCLDRSNQTEEDQIKMALLVLANYINLAHFKHLSAGEDTTWVVKTLCAFRESRLESQLESLIKGLERLIHVAESSEHCSQGVGVGSQAARSRENCYQFLSFYQQYYGNLSATYANLMFNESSD